jgi:GR25 family glycosyltransferase involved in LPS biosynthesis
MRTEAVRALAPFERGTDHFELDAANRYTELGYVSAFFDAINCLHTGRLTTERSTGGPANAYELNAMPQFGVVGTASVDLAVRVLNLDRRPDRWESFVAAASQTAGPEFAARCVRASAVDGATLVATAELEHLFRGNDFGWRRSFIGCALSHLALWRGVAEDDVMTLVFEDDALMPPGFVPALDAVLQQAGGRPDTPTVVLLGYHAHDPAATAGDGPLRVEPMDWTDYVGGSFAYLVSPAAAECLGAAAEREGVRHGIDRFLQHQAGALSAWRCVPRLVESPLAGIGTSTDSDIQHDYEALGTVPSLGGGAR